MTKIDLVTGFLGAGKTTFITYYVRHLMDQGLRVCILENDFGAVNIDRMLVESLGCDIEMVAGGCDYDCHRRRFRTKLIAMGMLGYDRVVVEPSGIYDPDEFYDALQEEPLDRWYEIGNVIAIVDARLPEELSEQSEYLLASEAATAGKIVFSHIETGAPEKVLAHLNRSLEKVHCRRKITPEDVICASWESLDYEKLADCGYEPSAYTKQPIMEENDYDTLYFMNHHLSAEDVKAVVPAILNDPACGHVIRIKGFLQTMDGWIELNATRETMDIRPIAAGQQILIVIGEHLNEAAVKTYFNP